MREPVEADEIDEGGQGDEIGAGGYDIAEPIRAGDGAAQIAPAGPDAMGGKPVERVGQQAGVLIEQMPVRVQAVVGIERGDGRTPSRSDIDNARMFGLFEARPDIRQHGGIARGMVGRLPQGQPVTGEHGVVGLRRWALFWHRSVRLAPLRGKARHGVGEGRGPVRPVGELRGRGARGGGHSGALLW